MTDLKTPPNQTPEALARQHLLAPSQPIEALGETALPTLTHGEGIYVYDEAGRKLIDGPAGMWCTQIGYARPEIGQAMARQAMTLSYNSPWYSTNAPAARLAQRIARMTPGDLNRIFFATGGSTAVDTAIRFAEFRNNARGRPAKRRVVVRRDGYHGSTSLTAAASGRLANLPGMEMKREQILYLSSPNPRLAGGRSAEAFLDDLAAEFEALIAREGADAIAAFLAEPVLASGGVIIPPEGYHARFKAICEAHDILYISDEVVTGFGRCGEWFASEKVFGVVPDMIAFAKGLTSGYAPLGGVAISDRLLDELGEEAFEGASFHNGYTYSGHPVSCAAALANIEVFETDDLLAHVREIEPYFAAALRGLSDLEPVVDVRSSGLIGCVECMTAPGRAEPTDDDRAFAAQVDAICHQLGLIVRPIAHMCVISPPLIVTRAQIDDICAILRQAITRAAQARKAAA